MKGYYTYRAAVFEFDKNGSSVRLPEELKHKTRGHLVNPKHQYILVVYGLSRDGSNTITDMTSGNDIKELIGMVSWCPLTVIVSTGRVVGPLAARHATWFIQSGSSKLRGVLSPLKSVWSTSSKGMYVDDARDKLNSKRYKHMTFGRSSRKIMKIYRLRSKSNSFYVMPLDDRKAWTY